jgi:hypothetical protein
LLDVTRYALAFTCALLASCRENAPPTVVAPQVAAGPAAAGSAPSPAAEDSDCGDTYVAQPAWSGSKPKLPVPPELSSEPQKIGDAYTVHGAVHALRSRFESAELTKEVSVIGFIVDTNLPRVDKCALHKTGIADPPGCDTEIPSFTIADTKDATKGERIAVLGWASNFSKVFEAHLRYQKLSAPPAQLYQDPIWAVDVPFPLPSVGAKVKVTGKYGFTFTKSSRGISADPKNGIVTVRRVEYLEPAPAPAKFPQLGK